MVYFFAFILIFLSIILPKNKFLSLLWIVYFIILFGFNSFNPDLWAYQNIYRLYQNGTYDGKLVDSGYIFLMQSFQNFSYSFEQFFLFIAFVSVISIFYFINKFSKYRNLVFIPMLLYPFTLSVVQSRFFFSTSIVLIGLTFLERNTKIGKILFLLFILLASTIHFSSILYLILILATSNSFKKMYSFLLLGVVGIVLLIAGGELLNLTALSQGIQRYFIGSLEFKGLVFVSRVIFFRLGIIGLLHLAFKYFRDTFDETDLFLMKSVNIIMFITMIFELVNTEFERFSRIGFIALYILIFNITSRLKLNSNKVSFIGIAITFMILYTGYQYFLRESNGIIFFEAVFRDIFENNYLLNGQ